MDLAAHGALERHLLTDPETSGGLLVTCRAGAVPAVLEIFEAEGFDRAATIGTISAGAPGILVR